MHSGKPPGIPRGITESASASDRHNPDRRISEWGALRYSRAVGGDQRGTAILAVTVTDQRLEACATFSEPRAVERRTKKQQSLT
jgi:hypothetical protein